MKRTVAVALSMILFFCACQTTQQPATSTQEGASSQAATSTQEGASSQEEATSPPTDAPRSMRAPLPDGSYPLLEDRLRVTLPEKGDYTELYPNGVMGTAASHQTTTKIVWGKSGTETAIQAREMFIASCGSFAMDAQQFIKDTGRDLSVRMLSGAGVSVALMEPPEEARIVQDATYMTMALVLMPDNNLIFVTVTASGIQQEQLDAHLTQVQQMLSSLQPGTQLIGEEKTVALGSLKLKQKQGYATTGEKGADFDVYRIRKIMTPETQISSDVAIYFGAHPSLRGGELEMAPTEKRDKILGKQVTWKVYQGNGATFMETVFPYGLMQQAHICILGENDKTTEDLLEMVRSLS